MNHGTSLEELGRGLGTKENILLGRTGSKETGQEVVWGTEVYLGYLKARSFTRRLKKASCFQFPSSISQN